MLVYIKYNVYLFSLCRDTSERYMYNQQDTWYNNAQRKNWNKNCRFKIRPSSIRRRATKGLITMRNSGIMNDDHNPFLIRIFLQVAAPPFRHSATLSSTEEEEVEEEEWKRGASDRGMHNYSTISFFLVPYFSVKEAFTYIQWHGRSP